MPYVVNGQTVPEELVRQESERIARDLRWRDIPDESKRARRIHGPAEQAAIDRVLVEWAAVGDPRPVDPNICRARSSGSRDKHVIARLTPEPTTVRHQQRMWILGEGLLRPRVVSDKRFPIRAVTTRCVVQSLRQHPEGHVARKRATGCQHLDFSAARAGRYGRGD